MDRSRSDRSRFKSKQGKRRNSGRDAACCVYAMLMALFHAVQDYPGILAETQHAASLPFYCENDQRLLSQGTKSYQPGGLRLFVRVIARAHQRSRFHMAEAHLQAFFFHEAEFVRMVVASHRQVIA